MSAIATNLSCSHLFPFKRTSTVTSSISHTNIRISENPILDTGITSSRRTILTPHIVSCSSTSMAEIVTDNADTAADDEPGIGQSGDAQGDAFLGIEAAQVSAHPRGISSVLNLLSKWMVAVLFGIIIVWKHDAEILWIAMGSVINSWFSVSLKKILNHQRPVPHLKSDPGMPSSHAQSLFYASILLILSLVRWLGVNTITVMIGTLAIFCSAYLSWLRVSQQFHTANQIIVGAILGSLYATLWFWSWHAFVSKAFISSIWVRVAIISSSVISCVIFVIYVIRHWFKVDG
ncbi:Phosphatidic acid phosphatase [Zostera marina]|uniref:Phosphatidic acid phosphatase n=1 Tax=Zostera marina TaxID=29655 RepID=A0A0K9NW65_ZOSMR|nr:Phosphatidic acid phosphatase [Zostera marina]